MTTQNSAAPVSTPTFRGTLKEFCARFDMPYAFAHPLVKLLVSKGVAKCVDNILVLGCARRVAVYEFPLTFTLSLAIETPEDEELGELPTVATESSEAPAEVSAPVVPSPEIVAESETADIFATAS